MQTNTCGSSHLWLYLNKHPLNTSHLNIHVQFISIHKRFAKTHVVLLPAFGVIRALIIIDFASAIPPTPPPLLMRLHCLMLAASLLTVSAFTPVAVAPLRSHGVHAVAKTQLSPVAISMFGGSRKATPAVKKTPVRPAAKKVVKAAPKKAVKKVVKQPAKKPAAKSATKPAATTPLSPFAGLFGSKPTGTAPKKAVKKVVAKSVVAKKPAAKPVAKAAAKKPVAKKPVAKKPVAKKPIVKKAVTRVAAKKASPSTYSGGRNAKWEPSWRVSSSVAQKPKPRPTASKAASALGSTAEAMKRAEMQRKAYEARVASERAAKGKPKAPPARSAAAASKQPVRFAGNGVPIRQAPPKPKRKPPPPRKSYLSPTPARRRSAAAAAGSPKVDAGPLIAVGLLAVAFGAIFNNPAPPPPKPEFPLVPVLALGTLGAGAAAVLGGGGDDTSSKSSTSSGVVKPVAIATKETPPAEPASPEAAEAEKAEAEASPTA